MRALGDRLFGLCCLGLAIACACSVFPESAVLPVENGGGNAGEPSGDGGAPVGEAGESGVRPNPGTAGGGSVSGGAGGGGGVNATEAGTAGQGGSGGSTPTCASPQFASLPVLADLWIGAAQPSQTHEGEDLVYVSGGTDERRALLGLDLPAAPAGAVLLKAELVLPLVSNADASKAARTLAFHLLDTADGHVPDPKHATWLNYDSGAKKTWTTPGADLGPRVAQTQIAAGTTSARVTFDVTEATRGALKPEAQLVPVVILESGSAPTAPAELAFTSLEGNASGSAALELTYCPP